MITTKNAYTHTHTCVGVFLCVSGALTLLMAIRASKLSTQLRTKSTGFLSSSPPCLKRQNMLFKLLHHLEKCDKLAVKEEKYPPNAIHKMCKVFHCGDVIVVCLKQHIWVDVSVEI